MQTTKFLSLVKQLIGKDLVTEVDSPSDFSMGGSDTNATTNTSTGTDTASTNTSSTSSTTSTNTSSDDSTVDLGFNSGDSGGAGLSPTYDVDVDMEDENPENQQNVVPAAPKYKILDVIFDEDDDLNTKVKIQNIDTGKVEIKNLDEIII